MCVYVCTMQAMHYILPHCILVHGDVADIILTAQLAWVVLLPSYSYRPHPDPLPNLCTAQ